MFNRKRSDPWKDLVAEVTLFTSHAINRPLEMEQATKITADTSYTLAKQVLDVFWLVPYAYELISTWNGCSNTCHSFFAPARSIGLFALAPLGLLMTGHELLDTRLEKAISTNLRRQRIHSDAIHNEYLVAKDRILHMACHAAGSIMEKLVSTYRYERPTADERDILKSFLIIAHRHRNHPNTLITRELGCIDGYAAKLVLD